MASDEMINEIWEIAQENSIEPIDKVEFGKDLRKSVFAELERATEGVVFDINNEFARALPIILHQAKANPDLIYENNGKGFSIASGILARAVLTVKYENRYIPGTAEYQKEFPKESVAEIVFTAAIADSMIKNYENLSTEERRVLNDNWKKLTSEQRKDIIDKTRKEIQARTDLSDEEKESLDATYAQMSDFERSQIEFKKLTPDQQDKFASNFLERMSSESPEKKAKIDQLRKLGLSDIEIRQMMVDDYMNVSQAANGAYIDYNGSLESKLQMMEKAKAAAEEAYLFNEATAFGFESVGITNDYYSSKNNNIGNKAETQFIEAEGMDFLETIQRNIESYGFDGSQIPDKSDDKSQKVTNNANNKESKPKYNTNELQEGTRTNSIMDMIKGLSDDELEELASHELKDYLRRKAKELELTDSEKGILEEMLLSREDDDDFADFFDDRDGFIQELEELTVAQQLKKVPVTDQEYSGTYRSASVDMVVDEPGLEAARAQMEEQNKEAVKTELESETDGSDTTSDTTADTTSPVQNDNEVGEDASTISQQPVQGSFIMTARREDSERDEVDGEGSGETSLEDEAADSIGNTNNSKANFSNFKNVTQKFGPTTDMLQEMGNTVTTKLREQDSPELANDNGEVEQEEIE